MTRRNFLAAIAAVSFSIAGCSDEPTAVSDLAAGVSFAVKPGSMRECASPAVATLTWNVTTPDVQTIKVFVVDKAGAATLFAHSASSGTAQTGPWVSAGTAFLLKDGNETKQLGKLIIRPTKC